MADSFPLYLPPDARRLFQTESLLRRFAQAAHWSDESSLLELHGSLGGLALAKALACHLTVVEPEQRVADALKERARVVGVADRVGVQHAPVGSVKFAERAFDGIFAFGRVLGVPAPVAKQWRPYLAEGGRLGLTAVVRVGLKPAEAALKAWEARLGAPLLSPRQTLMAIEQEGFEPEMVESLGEAELEEHYKELEASLGKNGSDEPGPKALREEISLHRSLNGKTGVSFAFMVLRRKEPGEKPPPSRDGG